MKYSSSLGYNLDFFDVIELIMVNMERNKCLHFLWRSHEKKWHES